jgi:DNA-3-methyladenine glycosylase II
MTDTASIIPPGRFQDSERFLRAVDPQWAALVDHIGPCGHEPKAAREPYEALIRAIAYQQLTAAAGDAILARLKSLHPAAPFPTAEALTTTSPDILRTCGFSATKVATILAIAEASLRGVVPTRDRAASMEDEALIERLLTIKGIGRWTVEMLLIYSLERMDVLPVDDFGVREGYRALKGLSEAPKPGVLREIGKAWAPHRTVASWYLWRMPRTRGKPAK